jgi:coatomer subunit beta
MVEEMLLVCNAIRNELQHHNEYVRGCALRFLCKMNMPEILEPLAPSVKDNMSHPHIYVRRNAVLCLYCMYLNFGDSMVPDAPELIERFLVDESDTGARRNAFLALFNIAPERAVGFLTEHFEEVDRFGEGFQLTVLEVARRACRADAQQKSRFVRVIFQLLNCDSAAVVYESATTLMSLSSAPTAVRAAAQALVTLLTSQSDINVKLIVLERLASLKKLHTKLLQELVMDLLRALACPEPDIQAKVVEIAMDLVCPRNIDAVMGVLKKEVVRTSEAGASAGGTGAGGAVETDEYRTIVIKAIHACCIKFPDVASSVVHLLLDFVTQPGAEVVVMLVREVVEAYPALRPAVLQKLQDSLEDLPSARVASMVVWILGEYCDTAELGFAAFSAISASVGPMPLTSQSAAAAKPADAAEEAPAAPQSSGGPVILADGTYASQSAVTEDAPSMASSAGGDDEMPALRRMLLSGECQLSAAVGNSLTKIALRKFAESGDEATSAKTLAVDVLILLAGLIEAGMSSHVEHPIHPDCHERLEQCICILLDPTVRKALSSAWLASCRENFEKLLAGHRSMRDSKESKEEVPTVMPDRLITFRQLRERGQGGGAVEIDLEDEYDIERATGMAPGSDFANRLQRVHQLTGLSDPVYAEAIITVHDYDIALELFVDNRTEETLTNLAVELATMGDLKLVERPQNFTIGPRESKRICASIKVRLRPFRLSLPLSLSLSVSLSLSLLSLSVSRASPIPR